MATLQNNFSMTVLLVAFSASISPGVALARTDGNATCKTRNAEAKMLTAYPAEWPLIASQQGVSGTALVRIDMDPNGTAQKAAIIKSTGNGQLDESARHASLQQKYSPELRDCSGVAGSYSVEVEFKR